MQTKDIMLVVDDTELGRQTLCEIFQDKFKILEAEDGVEAMQIIEQYGVQISVIILDIIMPNKNGLEVLDELAGSENYSVIPVIAYTSREEYQVQALQKGAWDYIIKSSGEGIVRARVENVIARKRFLEGEQEKKEIRDELQIDYLTGLLSRRAFEEKVNDYLKSETDQAIFITLDISNIKTVIDSYGHKEGEEVIRVIANLLRRRMSNFAAEIARIGGDQFAVFYPHVASVENITKEVEEFCNKSYLEVEEKGKIKIYCCAGMAIAPEHGHEFHELFSNADNALLNAKASAKSYLIYEKDMQFPEGSAAKSIEWLLDEATDAIYICDVQTYELLYINEATKKMIGKTERIGGKKLCYEYLAGQKEPCNFCKMHQMSNERFLEREFYQEEQDAYYILRGKQIEWAGRRAHIEYIANNTKQALLGKEMQKQLKRKELQVECTKYLFGMSHLEDALRAILQALTLYYRALNSCLIEYETQTEKIINVFGCEKKEKISDCMGKCIYESHAKDTNCKYDFRINDKYSACIVVREATENVDEVELLENICYFIKSELAKEFVEKELRQTTDQLEGTLKSLQSGTIKCKNDESLTLVEANDIFWELIGYSKEEFETSCSGKIRNIIKKNIWNKTIKEMKKQLKGGNQIQVESCLVKKDGTEIYVIDKGVLTKALDGEEYWYRTYIDITEQEKNRQETEKRYQHEIAFRTAMERTEMIGTLRVNLTRNEIDESSYHYNDDTDCIDQKNYDQVSMAIRKEIAYPETVKIEVFDREWLVNAFRNGETKIEMEYQRFVEQDKINWVKTVIKMVKEPITNDIIAFMYTYNVHKEKISSDIIAHAANKVYDMVTHIDTKSKEFICYVKGKNEPITFNYAASNMAVDMKGFFDEIDYNQVEEKVKLKNIKEQLDEKEDYVFTVLGKDKNGKEVCKKLHYSYLDKNKATIMLVRTDVTDIYEQEQAKNEMLRHALAAAEQANRAKTKFLSSMSHDIRTPMNAIVGMAQIASINMENKEKLAECMDVITSSSNHLLGLINDVLDMSKIENGSMILATEYFSMKQLMEEIQTIIQPEIEQKEQKFTLEMKNIVHDKLLGDPIRLNRVFINLLNNASKFTQNGGNIQFCIEEEKTTNTKIAQFRFIVSDNGKGIAKKNQKTIFEPFVREGTSALDHVEGTGLGLSIVKSIVEASGGTIKVESELGKGARFIVSIPLKINFKEKKEMKQDELEAKEKQELNLSGMNILLVEDHPINVVVARNMLSSMGANIEVAQNGALGLERFTASKENEFQVIFMDIQMPVMNGYEASKAIRESNHPQAKSIPIIAMTANVFKEDIDMAKEVGMNGHVGKPISIEAIAKVMTEAGAMPAK